MDSAETEFARQIARLTEGCLIHSLEIIEDRVPTDGEVRQHLHCAIYPDGRKEWKWRGQTILRMVPPSIGDTAWTFHRWP